MCFTGRESRRTHEIAEHISKNITDFARQVGQGTTDRGTVNEPLDFQVLEGKV